MFNIAFSFIALVFLLALVAYVLTLIANNSRMLALGKRTADLEAELLQARIDQIMEGKGRNIDQIKLAWNGLRKFRIVSKVEEAKGVCSFYLSPHDGKPLPAFMPGQHLTFRLHIPGNAQPVTRCYSLSDSPYYPDRYRITIKRVGPTPDQPSAPPGLVSSFFHDLLNENDIVDVKAPSGHFYLDMTQQTPVVLLAGGVGLTPLLSMLNSITESRSLRETWVFLGVRNKKEHMMKEHLESLAREHENVQLNVCYSNPEGSDIKGKDYHHGERVTIDLIKRQLPSSNYEFFICAPPPMLKQLRTDLAAWGVPKKSIHFEAFGPSTVKNCKAEESKKTVSDTQVTFAKSGKTLPWDPKKDSILEFAEENGITIDSGCRAGNCGTCLTAIQSGEVNYLVEPGLEPEAGSCLVCISVPKENLTLDA